MAENETQETTDASDAVCRRRLVLTGFHDRDFDATAAATTEQGDGKMD
jgi:hypothetical protein